MWPVVEQGIGHLPPLLLRSLNIEKVEHNQLSREHEEVLISLSQSLLCNLRLHLSKAAQVGDSSQQMGWCTGNKM